MSERFLAGAQGPSVTIPTGASGGANTVAAFGNDQQFSSTPQGDVVESAWSAFFTGGASGTFLLSAASYPSWLTPDGAGLAIHAPGLYAMTMMVSQQFGGSSTGWGVEISSLFGNIDAQLYTPEVPAGTGISMLQDVQAFQAIDLPKQVGFKYWIPPTTTWSITFKARVARLGYTT